MRKIKTSLLVFITFLFLCLNTTSSQAAESVLNNLINATKAVVSIKAQSGGVFRGGQKSILDKNSGRIFNVKQILPMVYTRDGAGVIIDHNGTIVTNSHTIRQSGRMIVKLYDGTEVPAKLLKAFPDEDIAFIRIDPPFQLFPLTLADSGNLRPKQVVYTIGNSKLKKNTIIQGRVKAVGWKPNETGAEIASLDAIEVNFDLYQGDSGSPVLNNFGDLLGIINAKAAKRHYRSFAIPSNRIKVLYDGVA